MTNMSTVKRLEYAVNEVCKEVTNGVKAIDWRTCDEQFLWHELVACILGSQVQHEHSQAAVGHLIANGLLNIEYLKNGNQMIFEKNISNALEQPIFPSLNKLGSRKYRYPHSKANQIRRTAEQIYLSGNSITKILKGCNDEKDARSKVVSFVVGVGPKQASLFLRNIGYARNLAILDTHILRYMSIVGLLPDLIQSISSLNKYETIEQLLGSYSEKFQVNMAHIDIAIWVVMRTCWKENLIIWA